MCSGSSSTLIIQSWKENSTFNLLPSSHAVSGGFSEKQVLRHGVEQDMVSIHKRTLELTQ